MYISLLFCKNQGIAAAKLAIAIDCMILVVTLSRIVTYKICRLVVCAATPFELVVTFALFVTILPEFVKIPPELSAMFAMLVWTPAELVAIFDMFALMAVVTEVKSVEPPPPPPLPPDPIADALLAIF